EPDWVATAEEAFVALERALVRDGRVGRYTMKGAATDQKPGFLDDQAYFGSAALDLYEATGNPRYANVAKAVARSMIERFGDRALGGFFSTPADGEPLIARTKDAFDHAIPSGPAMASLLCLRLAAIADASFAEAAERQLALLVAPAKDNPFGL